MIDFVSCKPIFCTFVSLSKGMELFASFAAWTGGAKLRSILIVF